MTITTLSPTPHITKVRRTLSLDSDLVEIFAKRDPDNLSRAVQRRALRESALREQERAALAQLVSDLTQDHGEPGEAAVNYAVEVLSA